MNNILGLLSTPCQHIYSSGHIYIYIFASTSACLISGLLYNVPICKARQVCY